MTRYRFCLLKGVSTENISGGAPDFNFWFGFDDLNSREEEEEEEKQVVELE